MMDVMQMRHAVKRVIAGNQLMSVPDAWPGASFPLFARYSVQFRRSDEGGGACNLEHAPRTLGLDKWVG